MKYFIMQKWWLIVTKQEMTKIWVNDAFVPVTLVKVIPQEIVRYKTTEKDGYAAAIVGADKKEVESKKGKKIVYGSIVEFDVDSEFAQQNEIGKALTADLIQGAELFDATGFAIGKGFQGMVKRCHVKGMGATHGHKFTRTGGSKGNRKPRRTMKGHPHAGHMGTQKVTLKGIKVLDVLNRDSEQLLVVKGSLPGARNGKIKLVIAK